MAENLVLGLAVDVVFFPWMLAARFGFKKASLPPEDGWMDGNMEGWVDG